MGTKASDEYRWVEDRYSNLRLESLLVARDEEAACIAIHPVLKGSDEDSFLGAFGSRHPPDGLLPVANNPRGERWHRV